MSRDWHAWHRHYDDPASSLSLRLEVVRTQLERLISSGEVSRLVSMCAGDGRDTLPVVSSSGMDVRVLLVELDPELAATARSTAATLGRPAVEVRTADAGTTSAYDGHCPADVVMACGVFGNVTDADLARTVTTLPSLLVSGGHVVWTRGNNVRNDPTATEDDPAELVRPIFEEVGFEEVSFVSHPSGFRVGTHRWPGPSGVLEPGQRMFRFV